MKEQHKYLHYSLHILSNSYTVFIHIHTHTHTYIFVSQEWTEEVFKEQPRARSEVLQKKFSRTSLAKVPAQKKSCKVHQKKVLSEVHRKKF